MGRYKDAAKEAGNQTNKEVFNIQSRIDISDMLNELDIQNQEPNEPSTWVLSPKHRRILIAVLSKLVCMLFTLNLSAQNKGVLVLPQGEGQGDSLGNVIPDTEILIGQGTNLATSTDSLVWDAGFEVTGPVRFLALTKGITPAGTDSLLQITSAGVVFKQPKVDNTMGIVRPDNYVLLGDGTALPDTSRDLYFSESLQTLGIGIVPSSSGGGLHIHQRIIEGAGASARFTNSTTGTTAFDGAYFGYGTYAFFQNFENTTFVIGTNADKTITLQTDGQLTLDEYTGTTFDDTPTKYLGLDASQNIITFDAPAGDKLGTSFTTGRIIFGDGTTTGGSSANLFWDNSSSELAIGHTSPSGDFHVISTDPTNRSSIIAQNDNSTTAFTSTFPAISIRNNNTTDNNYARLNFQDASSTAAAAIASQITDHTNDYGTLEFWTRSSGGFSQKMVITENGRIGIGGTPGTSSMVEITSTTGALTVPRMTSTQRDALTPVAGMIIYNTTTATFQGYTTAWNNL